MILSAWLSLAIPHQSGQKVVTLREAISTALHHLTLMRTYRVVEALLALLAVPVGVDPSAFVPEVVVGELLPPRRAREPLGGRLVRVRRAPRAREVRERRGGRVRDLAAEGEGRQGKVLLELEVVVEVVADGRPDVNLVLVQERAEVDRAEVRAPLLEPVGAVASDGSAGVDDPN